MVPELKGGAEIRAQRLVWFCFVTFRLALRERELGKCLSHVDKKKKKKQKKKPEKGATRKDTWVSMCCKPRKVRRATVMKVRGVL